MQLSQHLHLFSLCLTRRGMGCVPLLLSCWLIFQEDRHFQVLVSPEKCLFFFFSLEKSVETSFTVSLYTSEVFTAKSSLSELRGIFQWHVCKSTRSRWEVTIQTFFRRWQVYHSCIILSFRCLTEMITEYRNRRRREMKLLVVLVEWKMEWWGNLCDLLWAFSWEQKVPK